MTREKETELLDEYFGPREEEIAFQDKYLVIPVFDTKELIERTSPVLSKSQEIFRKEGYRRATRTNISQMEIVYPFLLERLGLTNGPLPEWSVSGESINEAALIGSELHKADAIFSITLHGIKGYFVDSYIPTFEEDEREMIKLAVEDIELPKSAGQEEIRDALMLAWGRYRDFMRPKQYKDTPFPGFGVKDPRKEEAFIKSREIDENAEKLAEAWAREAVKENPITWEFERGAGNVINQREIMTAIKFIGPNLQVIGRFDSISRREQKGGKVKSQLIDLKTGRGLVASPLDAEIRKRQAQLMYVMAERFTAEFMTKFKTLEPKRMYPMKSSHDNKAFDGRIDLAGNRYFDRETGQFSIERIELPPKVTVKKSGGKEVQRENNERLDFNQWFSWYGTLINYYKYEIKEVISRKPQYDLRTAGVDTSVFREVHKDN